MLGLGVLDAVVAPGPRCAGRAASSCSGRSTSSSPGSASCPGCRSTAAGSSGRSPGPARTTATGPARDRAGRPAARVHGHRRRHRDGARGPRDRRPARHRARLAPDDRRPDARPAARARAAAARRHRARGDGGRPAVGGAQPHRRHVRRPLRGPGRRPGDARRRRGARPRDHRPAAAPAAGTAPVRVDPRVRCHGGPAAGAGPRARRSAVGRAGLDEQRRASRGWRSPSRGGWPGCSPATACPRRSALGRPPRRRAAGPAHERRAAARRGGPGDGARRRRADRGPGDRSRRRRRSVASSPRR